MKALLFVVAAACASSQPASPQPATPQFPATPNGDAARQVYGLTKLERVDPDAIARALGTRVVASTAVSAGRTEYRFQPTTAFATIKLILTDGWQTVVLGGFGLAMADLDPIVIDAPYYMDMMTAHASDFSISIAAIDHRFGLGHSSLTARFAAHKRGGTLENSATGAVHDSIGQAADAPERAFAKELYVHWPNEVSSKHQTLRAFRQWAKENP